MKSIIVYTSLIAFLLLGSLVTFAQPPGGDGDGEDPDSIPIDGGVSLLIAGGAAYGVKAYKDRKKKNNIVIE